jgi:hypothetical protein
MQRKAWRWTRHALADIRAAADATVDAFGRLDFSSIASASSASSACWT